MAPKPFFPHKDDLGYKWAIIITPTLGWDPSKHPQVSCALYHCPLSSQAATLPQEATTLPQIKPQRSPPPPPPSPVIIIERYYNVSSTIFSQDHLNAILSYKLKYWFTISIVQTYLSRREKEKKTDKT